MAIVITTTNDNIYENRIKRHIFKVEDVNSLKERFFILHYSRIYIILLKICNQYKFSLKRIPQPYKMMKISNVGWRY